MRGLWRHVTKFVAHVVGSIGESWLSGVTGPASTVQRPAYRGNRVGNRSTPKSQGPVQGPESSPGSRVHDIGILNYRRWSVMLGWSNLIMFSG